MSGRLVTYVDAPELLDALEADHLLEKLVPVLLAGWRLGEPESPGMLQFVLDVEVGRVVEDGDDLLAVLELVAAVGDVRHLAIGRDGNGVERDWLGGVLDWSWSAGGNFGHVCCDWIWVRVVADV